MLEKFTVMRTRRWGNSDTEVAPIAVLMRSKNTPEDVIRYANDLIDREHPGTNEEIEIEVLYTKENGVIESLHRTEKKGNRSI